MQFYWIAPIMLVPLALRNNFGIIFSFFFQFVLFLFCFIINLLLFYNNPGSELGNFDFSGLYLDKIYFYPWTRIGPYIVGLSVGILISMHNKYKWKKLRIEINLLFWAVSLTLIGLIVFGLYPDFKENPEPLSKWSHIIYQSSCRSVWAMALGYIIYACSSSQGGIVNRMLTWKIWIPLARLSFSAYLIHLNVLFTFVIFFFTFFKYNLSKI